MSVDSWEEVGKYIWGHTTGLELYIELEGNTLYYYHVENPNERLLWVNDIRKYDVRHALLNWRAIGPSPLWIDHTFGPFIPPVILKLRQMEQRHNRYLESKNYV